MVAVCETSRSAHFLQYWLQSTGYRAHLFHGGHAVSCSLVGEVQGASDDIDLIMRQVPPQALLQPMGIHQGLQLSPSEHSLSHTAAPSRLLPELQDSWCQPWSS